MSSINNLSSTDTVSASDLIPIWSAANGDARKASLTALSDYIESVITAIDDKLTQYYAPSATGFSVSINGSNGIDYDQNIWLVLTPTGTMAAGTIVLPPSASCADKQELLVSSSQTVTALTVSANGASLVGIPTTISAGGFFRIRFEGVTKTWYRVG